MKNYSLTINGHKYEVSIDEINHSSNTANVVVNGNQYQVNIDGEITPTSKTPRISPAPAATGLSVSSSQSPAPQIVQSSPKGGANSINSPLPGTILSIKVKVGDSVAVGQTLLVLEAMKMENNIDASHAGVVKSIATSAGATVAEGDVLMVIE